MDRNVFGITTAYQFWSEIVMPNYLRYEHYPAAKDAFNICISIFHLIDWVQADLKINPSARSLTQVREVLFVQCPALGLLGDISNYSKHCILNRSRYSEVSSATASLQGVTIYFGPNGPFSDHPATYKIEMADGSLVDLNDALNSAIHFWTEFFKSDPVL